MIKMTEAELALKFIEHFTNAGQEIYKEVEHGRGRIDFVSVLAPVRTAVEVKLGANLAVLDQAITNQLYCHYSYVAIPWVRGVYKGSIFMRICMKFGVGILVYESRHGSEEIIEYVAPVMHRKVLDLKLADYQKDSIASTNGGYMTAYKVTVKNIAEYARRRPGCTLKEAMCAVPHHYSTAACGAASIRRGIERGWIKDFTLDNGKIVLVGMNPIEGPGSRK